jgi:hypothetical protein
MGGRLVGIERALLVIMMNAKEIANRVVSSGISYEMSDIAIYSIACEGDWEGNLDGFVQVVEEAALEVAKMRAARCAAAFANGTK